MACGTRAVAADRGEAFADAVDMLLGRPEAERRETVRARAECFGWDTAVRAFLAAHDTEVVGLVMSRGYVMRPRAASPWVGYALLWAGYRRPTFTKRTGVPGTAWAAAGRSVSRTTPITG